MNKTLYYDSNKHQLTIGDCALGDLHPVIVEPTLASDTFQISDEGRLQIKIDNKYVDLSGPSLIGPEGVKGLTIKDSFEPSFDETDFPTHEINDAYIISRDATVNPNLGGGSVTPGDGGLEMPATYSRDLLSEFPYGAKKGDLYVCFDSGTTLGPYYKKVGNLAGPLGENGDSPEITVVTEFYDTMVMHRLCVNGKPLELESGNGLSLLTEDDMRDLQVLIQTSKQPDATSLDDPLADLSEVVQLQAQQIEELQASLTEATARLTALEADTAWLKELNKEEMLQYWSAKTTTEE